MLRFGQKEVTTTDFYRQRQIADIFTIDVNKVVISDKVLCNNGKDCCYIEGYQVDHCLSRRLRIFLAMACHNTIKRHSMSLRKKPERPSTKRFGTRLSHNYLRK